MSTFLAPARRSRIADAVQQRARLSLIHGRTTPAPRMPFAALVLVVLGLGLVGLLVLNTSLQQGAFHARDLEDRADALAEQRQALEVQVAALREPQRVAVKAARMGMVPDQSPTFLRLSDGKVLGKPQPATAASAVGFLPARSGR